MLIKKKKNTHTHTRARARTHAHTHTHTHTHTDIYIFILFSGWSACLVPVSWVLIHLFGILNPFKPFIAGVWKCWWESGRSQIFFTSCWLCFLALGWQPSLRLHRHPPACKPVPCCWLSSQQTCSHWTSLEDIHNRHPRFRSWYIRTLLSRLKDYT